MPRSDPPAPLEEGAGLTVADPQLGTTVLQLNGRVEYDQFAAEGAEWARRFHLRAPDSKMLPGGIAELYNLELELYDPDDESLFGVVRAAVGRTRLEQGLDLRPELSPKIQFEQVAFELLSGSELVPLVLRSARLDADLTEGLFSTDERATLEGSGLAAEGIGLDLDLEEGTARFRRDGQCAVVGGLGSAGTPPGRGRLASQGPLSIRRLGSEREARLEVVARDRAILTAETEGGLVLTAREIRLVGRSADTGAAAAGERDGQSLRFESLSASGETVLQAQGHEFTAQTATFRMTESGALSFARLEGGPHAWLRLDTSAAGAVPEGGPEGGPEAGRDERELVRVWGDSTMNLDWLPTEGFQVAGPAQLKWRNTELWAAGGLSGNPAGPGRPASFHAWSGVEIDFDGWRISTTELDGIVDGEELRLVADAETRIVGNTRDGRAVQLRAREGLTFRGDRDHWTVPSAQGVTLTLDTDPALVANADELLDFDPRRGSFLARGAVEVETGGGILRGRELRSEGPEDLRLVAPDGEFVTYDAESVHLSARTLHRRFGMVIAEGVERSQLQLEGLTGAVRAERLELSGASLSDPSLDPEAGPSVVTATGAVEADLVAGTERYDLAGDRMVLTRTPTASGGGSITDLQVRGAVSAEVQGELGHVRLRSQALDGVLYDSGRVQRGAGDLDDEVEGELIAVGEVWLETLGEQRIEATGERLELRPGGFGVLEPKEDGLVTAQGVLPRQQRPFRMTARSLRFGPEELRAQRPVIHLDPLPGALETTPLDGLQASAVRLVALPDRIDFEGDVSFLGQTPKGAQWTLRSDRAAFEGAPGPEGRTALSRMSADGRVRIQFSDGPKAEGDRLSAIAWSGRIKLEGKPARILRGDIQLAGEWFEFDTRDYLIRSVNGWAEMPEARFENEEQRP